MRYRLAAFDIDGTLLGPSGRLSPGVVAAVGGLAAKGVVVAVATARPHELALPPLAPITGSLSAVVSAAGADIRHPDGEPISQTFLPPEAARAIAALCDEQDWRSSAGTPEGAYQRIPDAVAAGSRATIVENLSDAPLDRTLVVAPWTGAGHAAFPALEALVRRWDLRAERALTSSGHELIAITHREAGKGPALLRLCEAFGVAQAESVAFGDTEVDLPMLEAAALGVAMGDAPAAMRAAADMVTGTAAEDGVATAITRIWGEA